MGKRNGKMSQEIAKREEGGFLVLSENLERLQLTVRENIGDGQIGAFDLDRVKMPAGGGQTWAVTGADGEETSLPTLDAIIVAWQNCRAYWPGDYEGDSPPQCVSQDGMTGLGDPGGACSVCPFAQWGSGKNGRGQACKAMRRLFLLRPGQLLPTMLTLPPSSLAAARKYMVALISMQRAYWSVVTAIGLEKESNPEGIKYSLATFKRARDLTPEELKTVEGYRTAIAPLMRAPVTAQDYAPAEGGTEL